jgi:predicted metal-dependent peptidase
VLSSHDRRATLRSLWSPLLPEAHWQGARSHPIGGTQIYLDVSGSMNAEMPLIVKLLGGLSRYIERPFWAFSNVVARAEIRNGRLIAETTGGTSMACVLEHVARTRPPAAVVVTDGYIERLPRALVQSTSATRLHVIVTRDGNGNLLQQAHIPFTQLGRFPQ